jgi:hypothetical protein
VSNGTENPVPRDQEKPNDEVEPDRPENEGEEDDDTLAPRGLVGELGEEEDDAASDGTG